MAHTRVSTQKKRPLLAPQSNASTTVVPPKNPYQLQNESENMQRDKEIKWRVPFTTTSVTSMEIAEFDFTAPTNVTDGSGHVHGGSVTPAQQNQIGNGVWMVVAPLLYTTPLPSFDCAAPTNVMARPWHTHGGNVVPT